MNRKDALHLAIIPDGNRRWAKARSLNPWKGHETAIENFRSITDWCRKNPRIGALTVWCFSTENWKRDPKEVRELMRFYEEYLNRERKGFLEKKTRFMHSGRLDRIPSSLAALIHDVQEETKTQKEFILNLAVDYGGKDEIIRALNKFIKANEANEANEAILARFLDHPDLPDIDLVIRTSGEMRTSNFFLWESTYAEWIFLEKYFPDLSTDDLEQALGEFDARKRRFGS